MTSQGSLCSDQAFRALRKNLWVDLLGFGGFAAVSFLWHESFSQSSVGRRRCLLRRNCLSVSSFGYPSVGCSPAEPPTFHRILGSVTHFSPAGKPFAIRHVLHDVKTEHINLLIPKSKINWIESLAGSRDFGAPIDSNFKGTLVRSILYIYMTVTSTHRFF